MSNVVDLDSVRNDVIYIEYEGEESRGVCINEVKIDFCNEHTMIQILDETQECKTDDFINLLIAYITLVKPELIKYDE